MEKIDYNLIKGFGPSVLKVKIPDNILKKLNDYVDNIIGDKSKSQELNHGEKLVGDVTQELKLEEQIMKESGWGNFLANCTSKWVELETNKKIKKFQLVNSWIVRQFENEYNPTH